jgi:hypothetical protein
MLLSVVQPVVNLLRQSLASDEYQGLIEAFKESNQIRFNALYSTKVNSKDVVITSTKILGEVTTNEAALVTGDERKVSVLLPNL